MFLLLESELSNPGVSITLNRWFLWKKLINWYYNVPGFILELTSHIFSPHKAFINVLFSFPVNPRTTK